MLLNAEVITEVRETLGEAMLGSFLSRMLADVEETRTLLIQLVAAQDFAAVATTAHRAAGSAATVGAVGLHSTLKDIENAARDPSALSSLPEQMSVLHSRLEETRIALAGLLGPT